MQLLAIAATACTAAHALKPMNRRAVLLGVPAAAALPTPSRAVEMTKTASGLEYYDVKVGQGDGPAKLEQTVTIDYIEQPGDGRHSHVATLDLSIGGRQLKVAVCSTHLTAFPYLMESRRMAQLAHLTSALAAEGFDVACVMGDFNFHREAENASIPEGWAELPAVVSLGPTWDLSRNARQDH